MEPEERSFTYGRLIDYEASSGNNAAAEKWLNEAEEHQVTPELESPEAKQLVASLEAERKAAEARRLAEIEEEKRQERERKEAEARRLAEIEEEKRQELERKEAERLADTGGEMDASSTEVKGSSDRLTREEAIQFIAWAALHALVLGDLDEPSSNQQGSEQFFQLLAQLQDNWLDTTPEKYQAYFVATAKGFGSDKDEDARFLLTLEPTRKQTTVVGKDGFSLKYGPEALIIFMRRSDTGEYGMVAADIAGKMYRFKEPLDIDAPPGLIESQ